MTQLYLHIIKSEEKRQMPFAIPQKQIDNFHQSASSIDTFETEGNFGIVTYKQLHIFSCILHKVQVLVNTDIEIHTVSDSENISLIYCEEGYVNIMKPEMGGSELIAHAQFIVFDRHPEEGYFIRVSPANKTEHVLLIVNFPSSIRTNENSILNNISNYILKFDKLKKIPDVFTASLDFLKSISAISNELLSTTPDIQLIGANINILLLETLQQFEKESTKGDVRDNWDPEKQVVYNIAENIILRMDETSAIKIFSREQHLNPNKLKILFKKHMGMPAVAFRISVRMQKAKQLLEETNLSIQEISSLVGYSNPAQFSTMFKKKMGCTPNQLRKV